MQPAPHEAGPGPAPARGSPRTLVIVLELFAVAAVVLVVLGVFGEPEPVRPASAAPAQGAPPSAEFEPDLEQLRRMTAGVDWDRVTPAGEVIGASIASY
jgi:hypothetical protein